MHYLVFISLCFLCLAWCECVCVCVGVGVVDGWSVYNHPVTKSIQDLIAFSS